LALYPASHGSFGLARSQRLGEAQADRAVQSLQSSSPSQPGYVMSTSVSIPNLVDSTEIFDFVN
jgi:hypothetical protein